MESIPREREAVLSQGLRRGSPVRNSSDVLALSASRSLALLPSSCRNSKCLQWTSSCVQGAKSRAAAGTRRILVRPIGFCLRVLPSGETNVADNLLRMKVEREKEIEGMIDLLY